MTSQETHGVQVFLTDEQDEWIRVQAFERRMNRSEIVRELIDTAISAKVAA